MGTQGKDPKWPLASLGTGVIPEREALARRLCGMGAHLVPDRNAVAKLVEERARDDAERSKDLE